MTPAMKTAHGELTKLVESNPVTAGLGVRRRGKILTLSRTVSTPDGSTEIDDRVRLTHLGASTFGLSVLRHTGTWEKTPFSGSITELFEIICGPMQHIVADWG